jgi:hypothetical protein
MWGNCSASSSALRRQKKLIPELDDLLDAIGIDDLDARS